MMNTSPLPHPNSNVLKRVKRPSKPIQLPAPNTAHTSFKNSSKGQKSGKKQTTGTDWGRWIARKPQIWTHTGPPPSVTKGVNIVQFLRLPLGALRTAAAAPCFHRTLGFCYGCALCGTLAVIGEEAAPRSGEERRGAWTSRGEVLFGQVGSGSLALCHTFLFFSSPQVTLHFCWPFQRCHCASSN